MTYLTRIAICLIAVWGVAHVSAVAQQSPSYSVNEGYAAYVQDMGNGTHTSRYFGMSINFPSGWDVGSEAEAEVILNIGADEVAGDDEGFRNELENAVADSLAVMFAQRMSDRINVISTAEKLPFGSQNLDGTDYFDNMRLLNQRNAVDIYMSPNYSTRMIGGRQFAVMDASANLGNGVTVLQQYHALRIDNYMVAIITSYVNDSQKSSLDQILNSVTFD